MAISQHDKAIINSLKSNDKSIVLKALKDIRHKGNLTLLNQVFRVLESKPDEQIYGEIMNLLNDLKDNSVVPLISDYIKDCRNEEIREMVISSCWQSNLNFSEYLDIFNKIVVEDNYQNAVEAFTVVEQTINLHNVDQKIIENSKEYLKKSLAKVDPGKKSLVEELIIVYNQSDLE